MGRRFSKVARQSNESLSVPKFLSILLLLAVFPASSILGYPLTVAQQERLETYLPRTLEKLERRQPIHVALVGDGVAQMITLDENRHNMLLSLHGYFLRRLEQEFFYPGGVHLLNPLADHPRKLRNHRGEEILLEQFTSAEATSLNALQWVTTRVFLNRPDLVVLHLGLNDFRFDVLGESTRRSLSRAIEFCLRNEAEVILVGPTLMRDAGGPNGWGATRLHAAILRDLAAQWNVMFLDPGHALGRTRPALSEGTPEDLAAQVSRDLALDLFDYGPGVKEAIFMNSVAHRNAGAAMAGQLMDGVADSGYEISASAVLAGEDGLEVDLTLRAKDGLRRQGVLTALNIGRIWEPKVVPHALSIDPEGEQRFRIRYERRTAGGDGGDYRFTANMTTLPCSFLLSDLDRTTMVDVQVPKEPVHVVWDFSPRIDQRRTFPLRFMIGNASAEPVNGTYRLRYAGQQARGAFDLEPGGNKTFTANPQLPSDEVWRSRETVVLEVETGGQTLLFKRQAEAVQDGVLESAIPLEPLDRYAEGEASKGKRVTMTASASDEALQLVFDLGGIPLETATGRDALILKLALDGRPSAECQGTGFVEPLVIRFRDSEPVGKVAPIPPAAFGNGYSKELDSRGIQAVMEDGAEGKRVRVILPRIYFYRHFWKIGDGGDRLGLAAQVQFLRADAVSGEFSYPESATWVTSAPGLHRNDACGLPSLDLRTGSPDGWSVRLY